MKGNSEDKKQLGMRRQTANKMHGANHAGFGITALPHIREGRRREKAELCWMGACRRATTEDDRLSAGY